MGNKKTIYVDFDGTLAANNAGRWPEPGLPIRPMVDRVKRWLREGHTVKIFTARLDEPTVRLEKIQVGIVTDWCEREGLVNLDGSALVITNRKGRDCDEIWDDRAVSVNEYGNYTSMHKTAAAYYKPFPVKAPPALLGSPYSLGYSHTPGNTSLNPGNVSTSFENELKRIERLIADQQDAVLRESQRVQQERLMNTSLPAWLAATNEVDPPQDTVPSHGDDTLFEDDAAITALFDGSDIFPDPRTR